MGICMFILHGLDRTSSGWIGRDLESRRGIYALVCTTMYVHMMNPARDREPLVTMPDRDQLYTTNTLQLFIILPRIAQWYKHTRDSERTIFPNNNNKSQPPSNGLCAS